MPIGVAPETSARVVVAILRSAPATLSPALTGGPVDGRHDAHHQFQGAEQLPSILLSESGRAKMGVTMADETLAGAFDRLGIRPLPSVEDLKAMTESERRAAVATSSTSAEQYEQLPAWYRDKLRRHAETTVARRDAEQAAARRVS